MDWATIIASLFTALLTGGGIGGIFMFKENRRAKQIENDQSAAAEWKDLYEKMEKKAEDTGRKLDEAYAVIFNLRNEAADTGKRLVQAELLRCKKTPCIDRDPPLGA